MAAKVSLLGMLQSKQGNSSTSDESVGKSGSHPAKPYASGRWTKAQFWSFIRACLRQKSRRWAPVYETLAAARRPSKNKTNARLKWEYKCAKCKKWYAQKDVSVDHIIPAGRLNDYDDLPAFVKRLFCETDGLQVLCKKCHDKKTKQETATRGIK